MYFSDPGQLWNALSNVLSGTGSYLGNKASQFGGWAAQPQNALGLLAGAGTLAGGIGQVMGGMQAADRSRQLERLARRPVAQPTLDVNQFYQPMSDAARQAYTRQLGNEMRSYGAPPTGAYLANAVAEGLAKTEAGRMAEAQRLALQKYGADMGMGQNQRVLELQALGMRPGLPAIGNTGALGEYLKWRAAKAARERGNQPTPGATAGGTMPGGIPPSNYYGTGPNVAATGNLYPDDMASYFQTPYGEGENY